MSDSNEKILKNSKNDNNNDKKEIKSLMDVKNIIENSIMDSKKNEEKNDISNNISNNGISTSGSKHSDTETNSTSNRTSNNSSIFFLDIAVLNEISKASQMAMSNISFISKKITNTQMKKDLVAIYSQYSNILLQINQHFEKFGEIPESIPQYVEFSSQCALKANLQFNKSNSHIAEIMIQGLQMGIIKCYKMINSNYDIEDSTKKLLSTFLDFQKENIKKLNAYL